MAHRARRRGGFLRTVGGLALVALGVSRILGYRGWMNRALGATAATLAVPYFRGAGSGAAPDHRNRTRLGGGRVRG